MRGRPTKYSDELEQEAWDYIDNYKKHDHAIPSVVGLCQVLKLTRTTLYDWAKDKNKEFSYILESLNQKQELVTFNKSLTNEYNASIAKLLLGKHGYHDKQETKSTIDVQLTDLSDEELDRKLNQLEQTTED